VPAERFRLVSRFDSLGSGLHILSSPTASTAANAYDIVSYRKDGKRHHLDSQNIMFLG